MGTLLIRNSEFEMGTLVIMNSPVWLEFLTSSVSIYNS
jgi:hypothetical protein